MAAPPNEPSTVPARPALAPPRRRTLLIMTGDDIDVRPLPLVGRVVVGRAQGADVQLEHGSISRSHLVLELDEDAIAVVDQGGANGTTLRGVRLPAGLAVEIAPNEAFVAGELTLVVQEVRAPAAAAPATPAEAAATARSSGQVTPAGHPPVVLDPVMRRLYEVAARVARGTISTLIIGETGTGKEVLAEFVHRSSPRAAGPLVRVNCAAFAESLVESELFGHERGAFTGAVRDRAGLLEAADGGTVVLDEVGELPPAIQAKLLRVVEDRAVLRVGATAPRTVDVRFIAATNRDLEAEVAAGRFRRDLYFRLAGAVLVVPPLRDRPDEIAPLARAFLAAAAAALGRSVPTLDDAAVAALGAHAWPGNLRELRNVIERAVLLADGDRISPAELPFATTPAPAPALAARGGALASEVAALERQRIVDALARHDGNQTRAAASLGMPLRTFVKRIEQYGLPRPRRR